MSLNENQDDVQYSVRSAKEQISLIAKLICFIHRNDEDLTAGDVCEMIKDITLNEVPDEVEVILNYWIASEDMQEILAKDEVRH